MGTTIRPVNSKMKTSSRSSSRSCRLLPHGGYSLLVATVATMGWIASLFQDGCNFALVSGPIVQEFVPTYTGTNSIPYLEFGFAAYRQPTPIYADESGGAGNGNDSSGGGPPSSSSSSSSTPLNYTVTVMGSCTRYPEEAVASLMDAAWSAARASTFLALVVGGGGTLFVWCAACFVFSRVTWRWTGRAILLASLCQAGSFAWYATQLCGWNSCSWSYGTTSNLLATLLWSVSGLMMVCRYPPPTRPEDEDEEDDHDHDGDKSGGVDGASAGRGGDNDGIVVDDHFVIGEVEDNDDVNHQGSGQSTIEMPMSGGRGRRMPSTDTGNYRSHRGTLLPQNDDEIDSELASRFPGAEIA
jgi:hypothetical protein